MAILSGKASKIQVSFVVIIFVLRKILLSSGERRYTPIKDTTRSKIA